MCNCLLQVSNAGKQPRVIEIGSTHKMLLHFSSRDLGSHSWQPTGSRSSIRWTGTGLSFFSEREGFAGTLHPPDLSNPRWCSSSRSYPGWEERMVLGSSFTKDPAMGNPSTKDEPWPLQGRSYQVYSQAFSRSSATCVTCTRSYLINEISRLNWPAFGDFILLDLYLFRQYVIPDLLAWLSNVGSLYVWVIINCTFPNMHSYAITPTAK